MIFVDWKVDRSCSDVARSTRNRVRFGHRVDKMVNTPDDGVGGGGEDMNDQVMKGKGREG